MTEARLKEIRKSLKEAEDALNLLVKDLHDAEAAGLDVKGMRAEYEAALDSHRKMKRVYG